MLKKQQPVVKRNIKPIIYILKSPKKQKTICYNVHLCTYCRQVYLVLVLFRPRNSGPSSVLGQRMPRVLSLTARARHGADRTKRCAVGVAQTAVQRDEQFARARVVPMFAQPDALPGAQVQLTFGYRNGKRGAQETCFDVGRLLTKCFTSLKDINYIMCNNISNFFNKFKT